MRRTRTLPAALVVCVLVLAGIASCASGSGDRDGGAVSPSPVGEVLEDTDEEGRHYREIDEEDAPEVGIEVQPAGHRRDDADDSADAGEETGRGEGRDGWTVRLTLRNFTLSPAGTAPRAVKNRGLVYLYVDGILVHRLRTPDCELPASLVPRGTHTVTARLHADDGTVWAVDGEPVESSADITASGAETAPGPQPDRSDLGALGPAAPDAGHASPHEGGKAS